jgi:hypothetical protein
MRPVLSEDSMRLIEGRKAPVEIFVKEARPVPKVDPAVYARIAQRQRKNRAKK